VTRALWSEDSRAVLDYRIEPATPEILKSEEYLSKHPFGQIPVMEDTETGAVIYESRVICKCASRGCGILLGRWGVPSPSPPVLRATACTGCLCLPAQSSIRASHITRPTTQMNWTRT
jgi:hypothetical protein